MAQILLADDDAATRDLVKRALEGDGHTVTLTQDGTEALDQVKEGGLKFDLLVSDVDMPTIDGIALAEHAAVLSRVGDEYVVDRDTGAQCLHREAATGVDRHGGGQ